MTAPSAPQEGSSAPVPRITIVDDDRETREMLRMALESAGLEVQLVSNGLRLISTLQVDRPDVLLLDVVMSWIDGFELCRSLKKNPDFRDVPVVFISGRSDPEDIRQGFDCGCVDYFTKPLDLPRLVARVKELVDS